MERVGTVFQQTPKLRVGEATREPADDRCRRSYCNGRIAPEGLSWLPYPMRISGFEGAADGN